MNTLYLWGAGVLLIFALVLGVFHSGRLVERANWETRTLKESVEILRDRQDAKIESQGLTGAELCAALGGVWDNSIDKCM